jgi:hypothetical protein
MNDFGELSTTLAILSAMITPVVLISACGSLTISTANRLSRAIDRARKLAEQFEELVHHQPDEALFNERQAILFDQIEKITRRVKLLHRALACLYIALGIFVAGSVAIGIVQATEARYGWLPLLLTMSGAIFLLYTCLLLILEARISHLALKEEMAFVLKVGQHFAPKELLDRQLIRRSVFRRLRRSS